MRRPPKPLCPTEAALPRLAVDELLPGPVGLDAEAGHYLRRVLRLHAGDRLVLFDGEGHEAEAMLLKLTDHGATAEAQTLETRPPPACNLTVALATPKGERADWVVEKLTEVGVQRILWLESERTIAKSSGRSRNERWQRIARAAAAQSARFGWPTIEGPVTFAQFLTLDAERRLIADQNGGAPAPCNRDAATRSVLLGVGPEGGFTALEIAAAKRESFLPVCLSPNVLRIETAAIVGAAMILGPSEVCL